MDKLAQDRSVDLRYGIIGAGMMGREHIRNIMALEGVRVTALADPHAGSIRNSLDELAGKYVVSGGSKSVTDETSSPGQEGEPPAVFSSAEALMASGLCDAVVIATPNVTHAGILAHLFTNYPELHVLVEKPLCTTIEDTKRIVALAEAHRGVVWVGLEYRFMPPIARFLAEIPKTVGALRMVSIREHRFPFLPKVGDWNRFSVNTGGTLVEKCCHFFDLMNLVVRGQDPKARPTRVMASGGADVNHKDERYPGNPAGEIPDILDNAYVIVEYSNGVRAMLDLCMFAEASVNEQELAATGSEGKVEAFIPTGMVRTGKRAPLKNGYPQPGVIEEFDASHDPRVQHDGFHHGSSYLEHIAFAEAICAGGAAQVKPEDGLWSVAVGLAAHRSIDERRPVDLAELLQ
jgi:myo-inositol 2-dehydrogenase / D-chiro-inositol 1-dehydrogenase